MCLDDIVTYKHPAVGARTANKVLKQMRARNTWLEDLSESPLLNWRSFLASRSDAARIIGTGVVQFSVLQNPRVGRRQLERGTTGRLCSDALG